MKKFKQILAIIAIVILVAMYLTTLVLAIALPGKAMNMFFASIGLTIIIPIFLWVCFAMYEWVNKNRENAKIENEYLIKKANQEIEDEIDSEINTEAKKETE